MRGGFRGLIGSILIIAPCLWLISLIAEHVYTVKASPWLFYLWHASVLDPIVTEDEIGSHAEPEVVPELWN